MATRQPPRNGGPSRRGSPPPDSSSAHGAGRGNQNSSTDERQNTSRTSAPGNPARRAGIADSGLLADRRQDGKPASLRTGPEQGEAYKLHQSSGVSALRSQNARGQQNYGEHRGERVNKGTDAAVRQSIAKQNLASAAQREEEENSILPETAYETAYAPPVYTPPVYDEPVILPEDYPAQDAPPPPQGDPLRQMQRSAAPASGAGSFADRAYDAYETMRSHAQPDAEKASSQGAQSARSERPEHPKGPSDAEVRSAHQKSASRRTERRSEHKSKTDLGSKRQKETGKTSQKRVNQRAANARDTLDRTGKKANKAEEIRDRHKRATEKKADDGTSAKLRANYKKANIVKGKQSRQKRVRDEDTRAESAREIRSRSAAGSPERPRGNPARSAGIASVPAQSAEGSKPETGAALKKNLQKAAAVKSAQAKRRAQGKTASPEPQKTASAPRRTTWTAASRTPRAAEPGGTRGILTVREVAGAGASPRTLRSIGARKPAGDLTMPLGDRRGTRTAREIKLGAASAAGPDKSALAKKIVTGSLAQKKKTAREVAAGVADSALALGRTADSGSGASGSAESDAMETLHKVPENTVKGVKAGVRAVDFIKKQTWKRKTKQAQKKAQNDAISKSAEKKLESLKKAAAGSAAAAGAAYRVSPEDGHKRIQKISSTFRDLKKGQNLRDLRDAPKEISDGISNSALSLKAQRELKKLTAKRSSYGRFGQKKLSRDDLKSASGKPAPAGIGTREGRAKKTAAGNLTLQRRQKAAALGDRRTAKTGASVKESARARRTAVSGSDRNLAKQAYSEAKKEFRDALKAAKKAGRPKAAVRLKESLKKGLKKGLKEGAAAAAAAPLPGASGGGSSAEADALESLDSGGQKARQALVKAVGKLWKRHKKNRLLKPKTKKPASKVAEKMAARNAAQKAAAEAAKAAAASGTKAAAATKTISLAKGTVKAAAKGTLAARKALKTARATSRIFKTADGSKFIARAGRAMKKAASPAQLISAKARQTHAAKRTVKALRGLDKGKGLPKISKKIVPKAPRPNSWKIDPAIMRGNVLNRFKYILPILGFAVILFIIVTVSLQNSGFIGENLGAASALRVPEASEMRFDMKDKLTNEIINPLYYAYQGTDHRIVHIRFNALSGFDENIDDYWDENYGDAVAIWVKKTNIKEPVDREHFDAIWEIYKTINPVTVNIEHQTIGEDTYEIVYIDVQNWHVPDERIKSQFGFSDEDMEELDSWINPPDQQAYWFRKLLGLDCSYWEGGIGGNYAGLFDGISPDEAVYRLLQECTVYDGWAYSQPLRTQNGYRDCSSFVSSCYNIFATDGQFFGSQYATTVGILQWCESAGVFGSCSGSNYMDVLQPGDIIFWASNSSHYKNVGHVAIYAGNGMMWESAPSSNGVIYRAVSIQMPGKIFGYGRPLSLADKINWDGSLLPAGGGGSLGPVSNATPGDHVVPSTFPQTGLMADYTPAIRNWSGGTNQRALYQRWQAAGKKTDGPLMMLNGRYLVATVFPAGYNITIELDNGKKIQAITMDEKGSDRYKVSGASSPGADWGHKQGGGYSLVEWETNYTPRSAGDSRISSDISSIKAVLQRNGWYGAKVKNIIIEGPVS